MIFKKKNISKYPSRVRYALSEYLSPLSDLISDKFQLKGKIRLANRWARKNPKRLFGAFLLSMVLVFSIDIIVTTLIKNSRKSAVPGMFIVDENFNGVRTLDYNRENIRSLLASLLDEGQNLVNQIDSISKIENKTEQDSVNMLSALNRLSVITNFISNEEN